MANVKKGQLTKPGEWWKHLRWTKRAFWKRNRRAEVAEVKTIQKEQADRS
jgi:hypothetical protein